MIKYDTARGICNAFAEIGRSEKLLKEIEEKEEEKRKWREENPFDAKEYVEKETRYYNDGLIQMTIPSSPSSGACYRIETELGKAILVAHIAKQKAMLVSLNERARLELETPYFDEGV
jgi:CRISPR/Cas system-associated endonuclease Cas3-HD